MSERKTVQYLDENGDWQEGTLASHPETHRPILAEEYRTANVRDDDGLLVKDVTIIPPDPE
jgi:hypothetical protein